ncbi:MAG: phage tail protein [Spirochaetaceae bacterium]|nr:phage tail protein [Spirochaetaceae bacterium]
MRKQAALRSYAGRDLYAALGRIREDFPHLELEDIQIRYRESPLARFTVLSCTPLPGKNADNEIRGLCIEAASANPIRHLPANYQDNRFLRNFLMVFQHIMNDTALRIDNFSSFFRPMECPPEALPVLAEWVGAAPETTGSGDELRRFLRCALSLYGLRGTVRGLKARLALACGCAPRIIEGELPHSALVISAQGKAENDIFEAENTEDCFTIHFPVPKESFSADTLRRLSLIARSEKPAHTRCYISFAPPPRKRRKTLAINADTRMSGEEGFFI